jgi:hypothetical protein
MIDGARSVTDHRDMNRRAVVATLVCAAVLAGAAVGVTKARRAHEWAHGSDDLETTVELTLTDESGVPTTVARLGGPGDYQAVLDDHQAAVVRLRWTGPAHPGGRYQLVLLDLRDNPSRPLLPVEGWSVAGGTGSNWAGAYEVLPEHYPWLAGLAETRNPNGTFSSESYAVDAPADAAGSLTALFLPRDGLPVRNSNDLVAVVFLVDGDGEVRWAKRL